MICDIRYDICCYGMVLYDFQYLKWNIMWNMIYDNGYPGGGPFLFLKNE